MHIFSVLLLIDEEMFKFTNHWEILNISINSRTICLWLYKILKDNLIFYYNYIVLSNFHVKIWFIRVQKIFLKQKIELFTKKKKFSETNMILKYQKREVTHAVELLNPSSRIDSQFT